MLNKKHYNPGNPTECCPSGKHAPAGHMHTVRHTHHPKPSGIHTDGESHPNQILERDFARQTTGNLLFS